MVIGGLGIARDYYSMPSYGIWSYPGYNTISYIWSTYCESTFSVFLGGLQ